MPRTESKATVNNFVGGLVSDYHELNNPPNTTTDEDNCDLDRKGSRLRRKGIEFEDGSSPSTTTWASDIFSSMYSKAMEWNSVNEDGSKNFLVVQGGNILTFFDLSYATLADGELPFTVDLEAHRAPGYYTTALYPVQIAGGKGALFVVGEAIEPFYLIYDPVANAVTATAVTIKIRDFALQSPTSDYSAQFASLTPAQRYDLYNQGWNAKASCDAEDSGHVDNTQVLEWYRNHSHARKYPSLSKPWWLGKVINEPEGVNTFEPTPLDVIYTGNTLAALGTYILDAFHQDRSTASGIPGLPIVSSSGRPTAVAFGAGRVFWGCKNKVYFSQVIVDDFGVVGKCYQEADPTSEQISDLIDTDGGVLQVVDSSSILAMFAYQNAIFTFATNGVWALGGSSIGAGFKATDFSLYKVTDAGLLSSRSLISVEGVPTWWSRLGIMALVSDPGKQGYSVQNMLEKKMQVYYNLIPALSKVRASGAYDANKKTISWCYNSTGVQLGGNDYVCDRVLNYDTLLSAFYPYTIAFTGALAGPFITDAFNIPDLVANLVPENVVDNDDFIVTTLTDENVTVDVFSPVGNANITSSLKFLTFYKAG